MIYNLMNFHLAIIFRLVALLRWRILKKGLQSSDYGQPHQILGCSVISMVSPRGTCINSCVDPFVLSLLVAKTCRLCLIIYIRFDLFLPGYALHYQLARKGVTGWKALVIQWFSNWGM